MTSRSGWRFAPLCGAVGLACAAAASDAQAQLKFDRGQNVAPVFEGWERNPDGTFSMVFGYMNRNYREMPRAPVGPDNFFEPGPADRGQPTRFHARRQQFVFRVRVPADWGGRDLVWTLTVNGRTDKAYASLWPEWEIDDGVIKANRGMGADGWPADNRPPRIEVEPGTDLELALPGALTLTARVRDDGIPGPRRKPATPERIAAEKERRARAHPINQAVVNAFEAGETGLAVTWVHYRGPGRVAFDPAVTHVEGGRGGEAATTVTFSEPGVHVLRGHADDSIKITPIDVTVTVR